VAEVAQPPQVITALDSDDDAGISPAAPEVPGSERAMKGERGREELQHKYAVSIGSDGPGETEDPE